MRPLKLVTLTAKGNRLSGLFRIFRGLPELPSCVSTRSDRGDTHVSSGGALCNLLAAEREKETSKPKQRNQSVSIELKATLFFPSQAIRAKLLLRERLRAHHGELQIQTCSHNAFELKKPLIFWRGSMQWKGALWCFMYRSVVREASLLSRCGGVKATVSPLTLPASPCFLFIQKSCMGRGPTEDRPVHTICESPQVKIQHLLQESTEHWAMLLRPWLVHNPNSVQLFANSSRARAWKYFESCSSLV